MENTEKMIHGFSNTVGETQFNEKEKETVKKAFTALKDTIRPDTPFIIMVGQPHNGGYAVATQAYGDPMDILNILNNAEIGKKHFDLVGSLPMNETKTIDYLNHKLTYLNKNGELVLVKVDNVDVSKATREDTIEDGIAHVVQALAKAAEKDPE
jgi:hypothetical protein